MRQDVTRTRRVGKEEDGSFRRAAEWKADGREAHFIIPHRGSRVKEMMMEENGPGRNGSASV